MINPYPQEAAATSVQQDNERKIAAAELRRLAKAARHADRSSARAVASPIPRVPSIGPITGVRRAFGRGLFTVLGRRAPA